MRRKIEKISVVAVVSRTKMLLLKIDEATKATVGRHTARRDKPSFQGDEYHGHCDLSGGYEVSWTISGNRRHPNKFPADDKIPADAKAAVAKVLGVDPNILEVYYGYDEVERGGVYILQERKSSADQVL